MKYDSYDIIEKLKQGEILSVDEKNYLLKNIQNPSPDDDLYNLIRSYCLAFPPIDANVKNVEKYLSLEQDDIVLSAAIMGLCYYWKLTKNYIDFLKTLLVKENAYDFSESHIATLSALGSYIHENDDREALSYLFNLFKTELKEYESDKSQSFYHARLKNIYHALDRGIRGRQAVLEFRANKMQLPEDVDIDLITEITSKIKKK